MSADKDGGKTRADVIPQTRSAKAALLEQIRPRAAPLHGGTDRMRERYLRDGVRHAGPLSGPGSERRAETVRHNGDAGVPQELRHRHVAQRPSPASTAMAIPVGPIASGSTDSSTASAASESGMWCEVPVFIRDAETRHSTRGRRGLGSGGGARHGVPQGGTPPGRGGRDAGRDYAGDRAEILGAPEPPGAQVTGRMGRPGVAVGLCRNTAGGGEVGFIEVIRMPGSGALTLTGNLGELMQESARTALSRLRANAARYGLAPAFHRKPTCTCTCNRTRGPTTERRRASR